MIVGLCVGPCFVMHYFSVISSLQSSWGRESWLLYFNCLPDVLWLLVFCGSSSQCRGLVCSENICYFLIILIYLLRQYTLRWHYAAALCNFSFQCLTSGFMQLAATGCRRNILHCHWLFEGKFYLCIRMGITILKIIIWGGISSDMRSEVTFLAPLTCHRKTKFSFHMSNDNHPKWEFWRQLSPKCFCFNYYLSFIFLWWFLRLNSLA